MRWLVILWSVAPHLHLPAWGILGARRLAGVAGRRSALGSTLGWVGLAGLRPGALLAGLLPACSS
jgi:hypothetical protein